MTNEGKLPNHFGKIGEKRRIRTINASMSGYSLKEHAEYLANLKSTKNKDPFRNVDVVVLQEFGGIAPEVRYVEELMGIVGTDKKYYAFTVIESFASRTSYHLRRSIAKEPLAEIGIPLVWTPILDYDSEFKATDFIQDDELHPKRLYGYTMALSLYCSIFDEKACDQNNGELTPDDIPGETQEEKDAFMVRLKEAVQRMLDDQ